MRDSPAAFSLDLPISYSSCALVTAESSAENLCCWYLRKLFGFIRLLGGIEAVVKQKLDG